MRSANGTFPEYHTSADNIGFITPAALEESLHILMQTIDLLERDVLYKRVDGRGEPQLGRRGLYRTISGQQDHATAQLALLWVLNQADGRQSLLISPNGPGWHSTTLRRRPTRLAKPISFGVATDGVRRGEHIHIP